jgi:hypothetical protein
MPRNHNLQVKEKGAGQQNKIDQPHIHAMKIGSPGGDGFLRRVGGLLLGTGQDDLAVGHVHQDGVAILKLAREQRIGERVFHLLLDDAPQGAPISGS